MDWKDALSQIKAEMPACDDNSIETEETTQSSPASSTHPETIRISIDRRQRKGKTATLIEGFDCDDEEVKRIATKLKTHFGTGGSARGGDILLQGDWKEKSATFLKEQGYKIKLC